MTIHTIHEAAILERNSKLILEYKAMVADKSDVSLREAFIRTSMMVLETFILTVGGLVRPLELLNKGGGGFDELVDLYDTCGAGISQELFEAMLSVEQKAIVVAYPKVSIDLNIMYVKDSKFGVDVVFPLEVPEPVSAKLYCISTGKNYK